MNQANENHFSNLNDIETDNAKICFDILEFIAGRQEKKTHQTYTQKYVCVILFFCVYVNSPLIDHIFTFSAILLFSWVSGYSQQYRCQYSLCLIHTSMQWNIRNRKGKKYIYIAILLSTCAIRFRFRHCKWRTLVTSGKSTFKKVFTFELLL